MFCRSACALVPSVLVACAANYAEGVAPKIETPGGTEAAISIDADGTFPDDVLRTVDWYESSNKAIKRRPARDAAIRIHFSTSGSPLVSTECEISVRSMASDGSIVVEGTRKHRCGWPGPHREGVRRAVQWAYEEAIASVSKRGGDTPPQNETASVAGLAPRPGTMQRPTAVALVVGIEKYRRDLPAASGSSADARAFSAFAEVALGIPRRSVHVLIDSDATKSSIDAELDEWLPKNADDEVFFFFAGHGAPEPVSGARYLVPWDADPKFISTQGLAITSITARLAKLKAQRVLAFVDACFSGAGGRSVLAPGTRPLVLQKVPVAAATPPRLAVFAASGPDEITGARDGHGLFSYYMLRGLNGEADADKDTAVTFGELVDYVSALVPNEARRENRDQHPQLSGATEKLRGLVLTRR